jgi:hypothetical protein
MAGSEFDLADGFLSAMLRTPPAEIMHHRVYRPKIGRSTCLASSPPENRAMNEVFTLYYYSRFWPDARRYLVNEFGDGLLIDYLAKIGWPRQVLAWAEKIRKI